LFKSNNLDKLAIASKLESVGWRGRGWAGFQTCGDEGGVLLCDGCGEYKHVTKQCSLKWCPHCNWRIADRRRRELEKLFAGNFGLKHVVLTQRNFTTSLRDAVRESRKCITKLRRQVIGKKILGGCASMEITNEGNGWHLHWHLAVTSPWIDASALSIAWGKLVGQEFAIVKVKGITDTSYVQEVCKYAAKGSDIAKWPASQIVDFIEGITGTKMFVPWGFFGEARKRAKLEIRRANFKICKCGCESKTFGQSVNHAVARSFGIARL
jgi:hypothetical protein